MTAEGPFRPPSGMSNRFGYVKIEAILEFFPVFIVMNMPAVANALQRFIDS